MLTILILLDLPLHDHDLLLELIVLVLQRVDFDVRVLVGLHGLGLRRLGVVA